MKYVFFTFIALFVIGNSTTAHAYLTTHKDAFTVDGETAVFIIDYEFGHEHYDLLLPFHASHSRSTTRDSVGYRIVDTDGTPGAGTAYGVVLSSVTRENMLYRIPKGYSAPFRLLVLYTRDASEVGKSLRLEVTHLPFSFSGVRDLSLNDTELTKYVSPYVTLHKGALIRVTGVEVNTN